MVLKACPGSIRQRGRQVAPSDPVVYISIIIALCQYSEVASVNLLQKGSADLVVCINMSHTEYQHSYA